MKFLNLFDNLTTVQKSLVVAIVSIILYVSSTGVSYSVFSQSVLPGSKSSDNTASLPGVSSTDGEDPTEPRTEECPLNGRMHTKKAKEAWEKRIPLAVMIENHIEARPQSGLSNADVVYEAVAEGGITRFMAVFLCNLSEVQVGPVRSARTYFLDWESEYNALYAHVGGANSPGPADALSQIIKYKIKDLNQFSIGFPTFWRDYQRLGHPVATEHTMYSTTLKLWEIGNKRSFTNPDEKGNAWSETFSGWKFKDDPAAGSAGQTTKIEVNFWEPQTDYKVNWDYDTGCNCYKRSHGGSAHTDLNNKSQLSPKNVVVQLERESRANDGYENNLHLIYKTIGTGKALIFQDGKIIEGTWNKPSRVARTKYLDAKGAEVSFNRGLIWIETVPEGAKVSY